MTRPPIVALVLTVAAALACAGPTSAGVADLRVSVHPAAVTTSIGHKFLVRATIANEGSAPTSKLIAHLNVLSLDGSVYVDPEDWSSSRTRYLDPIPPGGTVPLTWKLQAVNSGSIGIYVAVLARSGERRPPLAGPTVHVAIARRQTLNSGGILPLALGLPALLTGLALTLRFRRRRHGSWPPVG